ncbi:carbohydrate porin [Planctomycetota bacterium]
MPVAASAVGIRNTHPTISRVAFSSLPALSSRRPKCEQKILKCSNSDEPANTKYESNVGAYLSCDQMLCKENSDAEDTQSLGAFFRFGYAPSRSCSATTSARFSFIPISHHRPQNRITFFACTPPINSTTDTSCNLAAIIREISAHAV